MNRPVPGLEVVNSFAYGLSKRASALLRRVVHRLNGAQRSELAGALTETAFDFDRGGALAAIDAILSGRRLEPAWRERLLAIACSGFDLNDLSTALRQELLLRACRGLDAASVSDALLDDFSRISGASLHYSQEGEDILLHRLFGERAEGFYVDIGAHHATRFSNTFSLYRRGWRGINVDATPGSMTSFHALRQRDVNLECLVSDRREPLRMHLFREPALNTTNASLASSYVAQGSEEIGEVELTPRRLADIMNEHVPAGTNIDLLSVDVEGEELGVLRSGDWDVYRPTFVIIEALSTSFARIPEDPAVRFLNDLGYEPRFRLFNSVVLSAERA
jgi:FkbM family methyltransferase